MVVQPYDVGNCLTARMHKGINSTLDEGQTPVISIHPHCIGRAPEAGPQGKEYLLDGSAYCMDSRGQPQAVAHVVGALACNTGPNGHDAGNFACNQAVDAGHVLPVAFQQTADCLTAAYGTKWNGNASATNGSLFAAQPLNIYGGNKRPDRPEGGFYVRMDEDTTKTLDAATGLNPTCAQGGTAVMQPIIGGVDYENNAHGPDDVTGPLLKGSPTGGGRPLPAIALQSMAVRRLTPVECERLQGFPDNYTNIPWRKKDESPDGPRYKALGNSWAVPNVRWIGQRIQEQLK
jgi:hypothetical protein